MKSHILILDTAVGAGRVALTMGERALAQRALSSPRQQAEQIFPAAAALLEEHGLRIADLGAVAVSTGPGPFTSLRVGLTAAKSIAEVADLPLIGISSFAAVARLAPGFPAAMLLPASRGDLFLSVATMPDDANLEPARLLAPLLSGVVVARPESWLSTLASPPRYVLSPSPEFLDLAAETLPSECRAVLVPGNWLEQLAAIARERYLAGDFDDPLQLDAAYARKDDADQSWSDPRLAPPRPQ
ncbi:MAG: tRNA (adenosine(37)-N6)-threonylcarbamoyltransferase complex dimerization subunit type 1 TsaB [Bryobacterales bacterium]|nr:tRNA (adenosine(37)-N6)-threonylcarbamoyltransferase complex dimerization subunit type 1 TsaB [Bryobacterales bacterium]